MNGTTEGNGIWQPEGIVRHFKTAQYIYVVSELSFVLIDD